MQKASSSLSFMRKTRFLSLKWLFDQKLLFQKKEAPYPQRDQKLQQPFSCREVENRFITYYNFRKNRKSIYLVKY